MTVKLLCVGDMHLGRLPARLPDSLADTRLDPHEMGPTAAWDRTVTYACREGVDVVILAGDVVESDNARYEAFGPLLQGVERLLEAGIDICAVAGNHDTEALPRLARLMEGFHLLGENGVWNDHVVQKDGQDLVRLVGWSFPSPEMRTNPLQGGLPQAGTTCPTLGLLHCDLYDSRSRYAPVRLADLEATGLDGWLLGHIHKPTLSEKGPLLGYLGSLVGLDPTETGRHGPWLITIHRGQTRMRQIPLAPLRWEEIVTAVNELDDSAHDLHSLLVTALREHYSHLAPDLGDTVAVGCRIRLRGHTSTHRNLTRVLAELAAREERVEVPIERVTFFVEKLFDESAPAIDLENLATGQDPPAILAAELLTLQAGDGRDTELIAAARAELERSANHHNFALIDPPQLSDDHIRAILLRAGSFALEELLVQPEGER